MIGATLNGKYRIVRELGRGTMGSLYEAVHTGMGRHVALKVLTSGELTRDPVLIARFHREATATGALTSQHVVQILDSGADAETRALYLVTELLRGEPTASVLRRRGKLAPSLALRIAAQACVGLANVHAARLVHRDIKPGNLFLSRRDAGEVVVKLSEFAVTKTLADQASEDTSGLTAAGTLIGTPTYMAPEVVEGRPDIDARADVWSLGVVLFELLAGRPPFPPGPSLALNIAAVMTKEPPKLREVAPDVPSAVAAIVDRALLRDREARWPSATELGEAIQALLPGGASIHVSEIDDAAPPEAPRPASLPPPANGAPAPSMPPPAAPSAAPAPLRASKRPEGAAMPETARRPARGRGRLATTLLVAAVALVLAVVAAYALGRDRASRLAPGEPAGAR